jgi:hypothetical protein
MVLRELKKHMPEYEKGQKDVFCTLFDKLEIATANASRAQKQANLNHTDNPSTSVYELVTYLGGIQKT